MGDAGGAVRARDTAMVRTDAADAQSETRISEWLDLTPHDPTDDAPDDGADQDPTVLRDRSGFYRLPLAMLRDRKEAALTCVVLMDDARGAAAVAFPSPERVAGRLGVGPRTVNRHLRKLTGGPDPFLTEATRPGGGAGRAYRLTRHATRLAAADRSEGAGWVALPKWLPAAVRAREAVLTGGDPADPPPARCSDLVVFGAVLSRACMIRHVADLNEMGEGEAETLGEYRRTFSVSDLARRTGTSRNTVKAAAGRLIGAGWLRPG